MNKSVWRSLLAGAAAIALSACTPYAQRVAQNCERLGAQAGTPEYWNCVQTTEILDEKNREMWSGIAVAGFRMMQPQPAYNVYVQPGY